MTLTLDSLRSSVPSLFSEKADPACSDRYSFIPTTKVVDLLQEDGWMPWKAQQVNSRTPDRRSFANHLVRFKREDTVLDDGTSNLFPEILLMNAHNGKGKYLMKAGLFRTICANGMVVCDEDFGEIRIKHIGFEEKDVFDASQKFTRNINRISDVVDKWSNTPLQHQDALRFASDAARLRWEDAGESAAGNLLQQRRSEDTTRNLWGCFQVVQENLLAGGFRVDGQKRNSRKITSIQKDVDLNSDLWELGTKYFSEGSYSLN